MGVRVRNPRKNLWEIPEGISGEFQELISETISKNILAMIHLVTA